MTRITRNTKDVFEIDQALPGTTARQRTEFELEDDDGRKLLFVAGIEVNRQQSLKLIAWLERAHRVLWGSRQ